MNESDKNTAWVNFVIRLKVMADEADALHAEAVERRYGEEIIKHLPRVIERGYYE